MADGDSPASANQLWRLNREGRLRLAEAEAVPLSSSVASEELATVLRERYPGFERFPRERTLGQGVHAACLLGRLRG